MRSEAPALVLRVAFLATLIALAVHGRGAPSFATLLALSLLVALVLAARLLVLRPARFPSELLPAALGVALPAIAAVFAWVFGLRDGIAAPWLILVGLPLALALVFPRQPLVPRSPAIALVFFGALALGLMAVEPWNDAIGGALLAALALTGAVATALDVGRTIVPRGLPPAPAPAQRRALAFATLLSVLALLLALGVDAALAPIPRLIQEGPVETAPEDRLADRVPRVPTQEESDGAVALVRVGEMEDDVPKRLYLRMRVLEEPVESEELLILEPRSGTSVLLRDASDGDEDRRIRLDEERDVPLGGRATFQVTLLAEEVDSLLVVPVPSWIEGEALTLGADGAIVRPPGGVDSFTYRTAGSPRAAFLPARREEERAALDPSRTALPETFAGRAALEAIVQALTHEGQDDRAKANAIATHLRKTGLQGVAPFRGWKGFADARVGSSLHFAQCFALLARLARIPARVVEGFRAASYDAKDRRFEVRGSDYHFWGEVALEGHGWIDFDPCPDERAQPIREEGVALAPERTDAEAVRSTLASKRPLVAGILVLLAIAAVLAFPTLRLEIAKLAGPRPPPGVGGAARRAWKFWQQLIDVCRRFGLDANPAWTGEEFARLVGRAVPGEAGGVFRLLAIYHACRFGGAELDPAEEKTARALLSRLPPRLEEWKRAKS